MSRILVLSAEVENDLARAVAWYNEIRLGLGDDLVLCVEHAFDRIFENPEAFPTVLPDVRRTLLRRFPYGVFYRIRLPRIEIEAVFHLRANPSRLGKRMSHTLEPDS